MVIDEAAWSPLEDLRERLNMNDVCEVCGNDKVAGVAVCRFCKGRYEDELDEARKGPVHRVVNIEIGRPVAEVAIDKLMRELERARQQGVAVLTIIHGYGSSGKGGVIRQECRKNLDYWQSRKAISHYIPGEEFTRRDGPTRSLLRRFPELAKSENLNKGNRGVTLVVVR